MNLLTQNLANSIVREIKKVLAYNINIMDASGVIIASSDPSRVGLFHAAALQCVRFQETIETYAEEGNVKPGVNAPLFLDKAVIGVVGVSGSPDKVRMYIDLIRIAAELLINQANSERQRQHKRQSIDEFISEWVHSEPPYSPSLIERGKQINIDVTKPYYILLVGGIKDMETALLHIRATLALEEYWHGISTSEYLITMPSGGIEAEQKAATLSRLFPCTIGAGRRVPALKTSLAQAKLAIYYGQLFHPGQGLYRYETYAFIHRLAGLRDPEIEGVAQKLIADSRHADLLNTLWTYMQHDGNVTATAQSLFVHRNTLTYRLDKIGEITGKDPRRSEDLFYLYTALVLTAVRQKTPPSLL